MRSLLALFAAVNPLAVAVALWPRERRSTMAAAAAIACAIAIVSAAVSGPILDALDVTPGTFRVAAAARARSGRRPMADRRRVHRSQPKVPPAERDGWPCRCCSRCS